MRRFLFAVGRFLKRTVLALALAAVILTASSVLLAGSQPRFVFREKILPPAVEWEWEIDPVYNNFIGYPITGVLRITAPVGARVDLANLPDVGDSVDLWRIVPPTLEKSDPGRGYDQFYYDDPNPSYAFNEQFEVYDRTVAYYHEGSRQVVEVTFTFIYLDPIKFEPRFNQKVSRSWGVTVRYFRFDPKKGEVVRDWIGTTRQDAFFYVVRRVEPDDQPIASLVIVNQPVSPLPHFLRLAATGLVAGMLGAQGWSALRRRILRRFGLGVVSSPSAPLMELYAGWQSSGDYRFFLEAIQRYREGFWGKPRPLDWFRTTFILYGGRVLPADQIRETFAYLLSLEVPESDRKEVRREPVS